MFKKILKLFVSIVFVLSAFLGFYAFTVIAHTPKIEPDKLYDYLSERSVLLDDEGNIVNSVYLDGGNRSNIKYKDLPQDLIDAVVSIEDRTFWEHNGFNFIRMLGAVKDSLVSGAGVGGTSTITQQLARNVYLSDTKSVRSLNRKISEAYYTVILEKELSKKEIMEAYLNTVYLGNNSYGVQAAAKSYFNKDAKDLDLAESAAIASMPQSPNRFSLVEKLSSSTAVTEENSLKPVLAKTSEFIYYYNGDASQNRRETTLKYMLKNKYITQEEYDKAINEDLSEKIDLDSLLAPDTNSYFVDYVIEEVITDLMKKYEYSREEAFNKLYTGGFTIHTTLDRKAQNATNEMFAQPQNFPRLIDIRYDSKRNIVTDKGEIVLSPYSSYFDDEEKFSLSSDEYEEKNGNLVLLKDKRLKFYKTQVNGKTDYSIEFNDLYIQREGVLYSIKGGAILVPQEYKSLDKEGNLVINESFFKNKELSSEGTQFFEKSGDKYIVSKEFYKLHAEVRQPQAAMVIMDYKNGQIKAMIGGRDTEGKALYNRALHPRQPGSAIKPLSIYSLAIKQGKEAAASGSPMKFKSYDGKDHVENFGNYWTEASGVDDQPIKLNGKDWPRNWYKEYRGPMSFKKAIQLSTNTVPVRIFQQIGSTAVINHLKNLGITSIVEDGETNDQNASALALGGMTSGVSPMEMTKAYGVFPNKGERVEPISYTKVVSKSGEVILEKETTKTKVLDEDVSFIIQDLLLDSVQNGIAKNGSVVGKIVGGKTGTTSDSIDLWFCGFTPQYVAALWIGSDVNLPIDDYYYAIGPLWSKIMYKATLGMNGVLPSKPENVIRVGSDYFIKGTEKGVKFKYVGEKGKEEEVDENDKEENDENSNENSSSSPSQQSQPSQQPNQPQQPPATPQQPPVEPPAQPQQPPATP